MASGGVRQDFGTDENITPGEARTIRFRVTDEDGSPIANLSGYQFAWFLIPNAWSANGITDLQAANEVAKAHGVMSVAAPNVDVPLLEADLLGMRGRHWHEFWRVDAGNERRLSYGYVEIID